MNTDKRKVTMQDIADSTGFSRNTVSKALNAHDSLPKETRDFIIAKAAEMGYKQYALLEEALTKKEQGNIALFTLHMPGGAHFGSQFLSGFEKYMSQRAYTLTIHILRQTDIENLLLPYNFNPKSTEGILCIELFDPAYCRFLCKQNIPVIFADSFADSNIDNLPADLIMMDNRYSMRRLTELLIDKKAENIGFVGDKDHCRSFNERWLGFVDALAGIKSTPLMESSILDRDSSMYGDTNWMAGKLQNMARLPDAFVCANDFIAITLMSALKKLGLSVPNDVMLCGFDDSPEANIIEPKLTTVKIPSYDMGTVAAQMLEHRIENPHLSYQTSYMRTELKLRETT